MKALTLWQPWATLVAGSVKTVETRSWGTSYRGPVAIHAAKKFDDEIAEHISDVVANLKLCCGLDYLRPECRRALHDWPWRDTLGSILCVAELVDCRPMLEAPDAQEELFGTFGEGRWGWVFDVARLRVLHDPVPCKGNRQLWDVPPDIEARL